jgi:hypothetical protein
LENKGFLSDVMLNNAEINLSGCYYRRWKYSGKALVSQ